uniref:Carotenoid biosynthesis protein n=1 Tax=Roseihalotalea indica TaxID=2867963 RepID=A0AA49GNG1_9BACT|nr:carotenoid biosynthesis protein [Tunicatimonas sp. TK19036]
MAGVIGLAWPVTRPYFEWATPVNLIVSAIILLTFHTQWNISFYIFLIISILLGYSIEVIGVHTQAIFGAYQYGNTLGYKLLDVPLVIGVNWLILAYGFGCICAQIPIPPLFKALIAALFMVALDYIIEPVAVYFDFWRWENNTIPLQNYLGWFGVATAMQTMFMYLPFKKQNLISFYLIVTQIIFFLLLRIIVV